MRTHTCTVSTIKEDQQEPSAGALKGVEAASWLEVKAYNVVGACTFPLSQRPRARIK